MALKGVKVVEMLGLAPGPYCGMILAEFGASVTIVDKINPSSMDVLGNGKKSIAVNLKSNQGKKILRDICKSTDVLIEPFRPGVMEKNGLGPNVLLLDNPKLIYARLTGFGQNGELSSKGGHDINYASVAGILSAFGRKGTNPFPPVNLAADFAGGGLMCALGIVMALYERTSSNRGQVIDCSMVEGASYAASWIYRSQNLPIWGKPRGENILDGGAHFYDTYETKDGKFMAVGAIEPKFYAELLNGLGLSDNDDQFSDLEKQKIIFGNVFKTRTQKEWCQIFDSMDACVTPVLTLDEAPTHSHNISRNAFTCSHRGQMVPSPAPRLDRTPATSLAALRPPYHGEHTEDVLYKLDYTQNDIRQLHDEGVIYVHPKSNL